ncbi:MAG: four helix bundle protein [Smithellaceae bacterium]|jgi:four helix bundle protein
MEKENGKIKNFRDLDVRKLGMEIVFDFYKYTKSFPKEEVYGLVSQMRRAALSIASNIAEGFNRYHNKEYRQFLYVALGSCAELETQIEVSLLLGYITQSARYKIIEKLDYESRMLRNLIKRLNA